MTLEVQKIDLRALSNDTHFSFHNAGLAVFTAVQTENELFKGYLKAWQDAFKRQDDAMYLLRKSLELEKANAQHDVRCTCLTAIMMGVRTHAECPHSPHYEVAKAAYAHLACFRMQKHAGIDKVSSSIHHISDYLKKEEVQTLLTSVGLKEIYDKMIAANEAVIKSQALRDEVESLKGTGGVMPARKDTDAAYAVFVKSLNSMMMLFPGIVEESVTKWNTTVNRYRKNLELKQALAASRKKAEEQQGQAGQPPVTQGEQNKPAAGDKPNNPAGDSTTGQNKPSTDTQVSPEGSKPAEGNKPNEGNPPTGGNQQTEGNKPSGGTANQPDNQTPPTTDGNTSGEGSGTGSGPIYTPVKPAQEVGV